jgi:hypothetical protein
VHVVRPHVHVKRLPIRSGAVDERNRRIDKSAGYLRPLHPGDRLSEPLCVGPDLSRCLGTGFHRQWKQLCSHAFEIRQRRVEAILGNFRRIIHVALAAQVPFPEMPRGVAVFAQGARERWRFWIEPIGHSAPRVVGAVV